MFVRIIKFARQERFILIVMAATVVAFSIVSLFSYQVTHWFEVRFFDSAVGQIQRGLDADSRYVFQQAGEIATSSVLRSSLRRETSRISPQRYRASKPFTASTPSLLRMTEG
jgi:cell shape-determining protein MreC